MFATARAEADKAPAAVEQAESYNFGRAGNISNEQMRAISTVNDLFARNLMQSIGAWLRIEYKVQLVSGEQMAYTEFVERMSEGTYVCSIRLEPLGARGLMEIELALASPMVDLLLGGKGRPEPPRALTDIEELIMASVVQMMVKELNAAWAPVGLQFSFERRETTAQVARMMPAGEKTLCVCFEVKMPEVQGVLNICLPAVVLNTILRRLISEGDRRRKPTDDVPGAGARAACRRQGREHAAVSAYARAGEPHCGVAGWIGAAAADPEAYAGGVEGGRTAAWTRVAGARGRASRRTAGIDRPECGGNVAGPGELRRVAWSRAKAVPGRTLSSTRAETPRWL